MKSNYAGVENAATNLGEVLSMHVVPVRLATPYYSKNLDSLESELQST